MGFFDFFRREKRAEATPECDDVLLRALIGGDKPDEAAAMSVPAFAACVDFIANTVAGLPVKLYRDCAERQTAEEVAGDIRVQLLNDDGGDLMTAYEARRAQIRDMLLHGAGYMYIDRSGGAIRSLRYVRQDAVSVSMNADPIFKDADISVNGRKYYPWDFITATRCSRNGVTGRGLLEQISGLLNTAYNEMMYENSIARTGGNKKGFLLSERKLSPEALDKLKAAWREMYSNNGNNMMVLNDGVKYEQSASTSVEMQLNEHKLTNADMIAQCFGLSAAVISGKASTEEYMAAVRTAVIPVAEEYQAALDRSLLLESEKKDLYFVLDTTELLKGDMTSRFNAYSTALQNNIMSIDEIRYRENLPPLGFNYMKLNLADVLYDPKSGDIITPNTGVIQRTDGSDGIPAAVVEERARHWTKGAHGYFTGSWSDGVSGGANSLKKALDKSGKSGIIKLKDDYIGRSLSAKAKNYNVFDPASDETFRFVEGTKIQNREVFAGYGTKVPLHEGVAEGLTKTFGGDEGKWQHAKGIGVLDYHGEERTAEVHWFQEQSVGKVKFKVKEWLD